LEIREGLTAITKPRRSSPNRTTIEWLASSYYGPNEPIKLAADLASPATTGRPGSRTAGIRNGMGSGRPRTTRPAGRGWRPRRGEVATRPSLTGLVANIEHGGDHCGWPATEPKAKMPPTRRRTNSAANAGSLRLVLGPRYSIANVLPRAKPCQPSQFSS
jgi:hypothetical protein